MRGGVRCVVSGICAAARVAAARAVWLVRHLPACSAAGAGACRWPMRAAAALLLISKRKHTRGSQFHGCDNNQHWQQPEFLDKQPYPPTSRLPDCRLNVAFATTYTKRKGIRKHSSTIIHKAISNPPAPTRNPIPSTRLYLCFSARDMAFATTYTTTAMSGPSTFLSSTFLQDTSL